MQNIIHCLQYLFHNTASKSAVLIYWPASLMFAIFCKCYDRKEHPVSSHCRLVPGFHFCRAGHWWQYNQSGQRKRVLSLHNWEKARSLMFKLCTCSTNLGNCQLCYCFCCRTISSCLIQRWRDVDISLRINISFAKRMKCVIVPSLFPRCMKQ
jgi:hypothetical protein